MSYQYDSLNRLIAAVTTGPEWGQSFNYDGFGNLLNQTVTKGTAPSLAVNVDGNTNRIITGGYSYDANGNLTAMPLLALSYDVENRLVQAVHSSMGTDRYGYDLANRRLWKRQEGSVTKEYTYFYGVNGQLLGTYLGSNGLYTEHTNVWFGGTLIWAEGRSGVADRLGSVVDFGRKYYPYGEEPAATEQNRTKFATYLRDETTALDYAVNRYYGRTIGRFLTPDPYQGSGGPADPQSWKRYDLRDSMVASRRVSDVVGSGNPEGNKTLGEALDGSDARVISGSRGSAILLGGGFFGSNLDNLTDKEWKEFLLQRGSTLLHEMLHVYNREWGDSDFQRNWAEQMFIGGQQPAYGGSIWISIWIHNDCKPVDPKKPSTFW